MIYDAFQQTVVRVHYILNNLFFKKICSISIFIRPSVIVLVYPGKTFKWRVIFFKESDLFRKTLKK